MEDGPGGQGLIVIAIIVITFINWLSQTLKQKAAKKNGELVDESNEKVNVVNEQAQHRPVQDIGESPASQMPGPEMGIRELLATLSGAEAPEQPRPVPVITQEQQEQEIVQEVQSVTEVSDWKPELRTESSGPKDPIPKPKLTIRSASKPKKTHPIALKLRSGGGAKEAIILSEILGKPKAFQEQ